MREMKILLGLLVWLITGSAMAQWTVDPQGSYVGFASVKNELIAENHSFKEISGSVSTSGEAEIVIALASVETNIPIRNERMQAMLFNVANNPTAVVSSLLAVGEYTSLAVGQSINQDVRLNINLNGTDVTRNAKVKVTRSADDAFEVTSLGPVLVHASQFALAEGVEALRKVAGLQSIELMVPVTFDLRLVATPQ